MNLKGYILEQVSDRKLSPDIAKKILKGLKEEDPEPIAIIGMAGRFADSDNKEELWNHLMDRKNSIRILPKNRIDDIQFLKEDSCYAEFLIGIELGKEENLNELLKKCGYLNEIDKFDYEFFGISANEAKYMDPFQRIFLETVYHAFEDGGYAQDSLYGTKTGVFTGRDHTYLSLYQYCTKPDQMHMTGSWTGILSSRISYIFNLTGPSIVIDTACSSGLVAVHTACQSLLRGECDMAIAGGISLTMCEVDADRIAQKRNLKTALDMSMVEAQDSYVRTFDNDASGTVWGEGVGAVFLKPLGKAICDGDVIHAIIKGSAINNDGASNGITAPSAEAQTDVMLKAWENAKINPETLSYIEAHGTGTKLGDPIEIRGISNAFREFTDKKQFCGIGTVKTNIGHLVGAAGMASLFKVVMSMENKCIPASINFNMPNQYIDFVNSPLYIMDHIQEWKKQEYPLRAGINSFGFNGTNCHMVIEEFSVDYKVDNEDVNEDYVLTLSAKNLTVLNEMIRIYHIYLDKADDNMIQKICYTSNVGRGHYEFRIAVIGKTISELMAGLAALDGLVIDENQSDYYYGRFKAIGNQRPITNEFQIKEEEIKALTEETNKIMSDYNLSCMDDRESLRQICKNYVHGANVKWNDLYSGRKVNKVSLPLYPFISKRVWAPMKEIVRHVKGEEYKHPLFECLLSSSVNENVFLSIFTVDDYWILNEHNVTGLFIVPGAAYVEIAREAGKSVFGEDNITLENIIFYQPLVVSKNSIMYVQTIISKIKDHIEFLIVSSSIGDFSRMEDVKRHAEGKIYLNTEKTDNKKVWIEQKRNKLNIVEKHKSDKDSNFNLGSRWDNIAEEYQGENELLVLLKLKDIYSYDMELYNLHPSLLDNAVNAAIQTVSQGFYLPLFYKQIKVFNRLPIEFYSHIKKQNNADQTIRLNVELIDVQGNVLVSILGYEIKKVTKMNLLSKTVLGILQMDWKKHELKDIKYFKHETILLFNAMHKFSNDMKDYFRRSGHQVIIVKYGTKYEKIENGIYSVCNELDDYIRLFMDLKKRNIDRIIHLFSMDSIYDPNELDLLEANQKKGIYSILNILKAITAAKIKTEIKLNVITNNSCQVISEDKTMIPENAALHDFLRVIGKEYPRLIIKSIDVDTSTKVEVLISQLVSTNKNSNVAYRNNERYIHILRKINSMRNHSKDIFKDGGTYLITGGSGGLGLEVAKHITDKYKVNIVLIGRTKLCNSKYWDNCLEESDNIKLVRLISSIKDIENKESQVLYKCIDVANYNQVVEMIHNVHEKFGKISGVIHAAGVAGDGFIINKEITEFKEVTNPKIYGTWNIDHATRDEPLDFFVMFSSIETVLASPGQADYVTANSYMNAYASYRNRQAANTIAIAWPVWSNVGMAKDMDVINKNVENIFVSLSSENALVALDTTIDANYENIIPAELNYNMDIKYLDNLDFELDDSILRLLGKNKDKHPKTESIEKTVHVVGKSTEDTELAEIQEELANIWGKVFDSNEIDIYESFYSLGGDSIMAMQLFKEIDLRYPEIIDISDIFTYTSISQLSEFVMLESKQTEKVTEIIFETEDITDNDDDLRALLVQVESGEISVESGFEILDED